MTPYLQDADCTLHHGDVLDVLAQMPAESVDCVVCSPPYWGLRDYGTGAWEGGDEGCDHATRPAGGSDRASTLAGTHDRDGYGPDGQFRDVCGKCGARRVDQQIGLEPTPDQYVQRMVEVFREVRRVLCAHGTCWVNLGDSYIAAQGGRQSGVGEMPAGTLQRTNEPREREDVDTGAWASRDVTAKTTPARGTTDLKPKDLAGIPWMVAFALRADGWWLRSDIVWAKPNPMPESVTDRPTKSHEYVFLLTKQPRYFFDQEAVREPAEYGRGTDPSGRMWDRVGNGDKSAEHTPGAKGHTFEGGRNVRSVWTIATQPYPEAHFATYPEELVRRCVLAGCPERVCRTCGKASERLVDVQQEVLSGSKGRATQKVNDHNWEGVQARTRKLVNTLGWSDCGCLLTERDGSDPAPSRSVSKWRTGVVLDPFAGSGTTCKVARDHGRHSIGIDLNADYLALAARRLQQQSLFSEPAA